MKPKSNVSHYSDYTDDKSEAKTRVQKIRRPFYWFLLFFAVVFFLRARAHQGENEGPKINAVVKKKQKQQQQKNPSMSQPVRDPLGSISVEALRSRDASAPGARGSRPLPRAAIAVGSRPTNWEPLL